MLFAQINPEEIRKADERISKYINKTPVIQSDFLNEKLGGKIFFKFEGQQKTGAFKIRGALNTLLSLKEQNKLPEHVVTFSSGNHAQAVAYASNLLGIKATIFIPEFASNYKIQTTKELGSEVILTKTRQEAEKNAKSLADNGAYLMHPYDNDYIIAGQGTACYEALLECLKPDAVFATIGGGGWISGTLLAAKLLSPDSVVIGAEPEIANDAFRSYKSGQIFKWPDTPMTIADGARTLCISERSFQYIKRLDDIIEASEKEIIYWTQMIAQNLRITVEPTSCVAAAACAKWLSGTTNKGKTALVMLSGGNIDEKSFRELLNQELHINTTEYELTD